MNKSIILALSVCFSACKPTVSDIPQAEIGNGLVSAKLYLPDLKKGYYRGTRFDWAGVIPELKYRGHDYFGQWFPTYDPKLNDAICGPVEEFFEMGYADAPTGGEFLRIGIGGLRKTSEEKHNRFGYYEIVNPGKRSLEKAPDRITFTHQIDDVAGYSYLYDKTVRLVEGKPELVLEHTLKNTGAKTIKTVVYDHNFFTIDRQPTGPDIVIKFPFEIAGNWNKDNTAGVIRGKDITYVRLLNPDESVYMNDLHGFTDSAGDYDFSIENIKTGAGVRITCDRPISRMIFWASPTTSCPEPYIDINIPPGEQFTWNITYEFYVFAVPANPEKK